MNPLAASGSQVSARPRISISSWSSTSIVNVGEELFSIGLSLETMTDGHRSVSKVAQNTLDKRVNLFVLL